MGSIARKYAHSIPFIVKINHNESLTYPGNYDQVLFASVKQAWNMGAVAIGATIYFGSAESTRQITEISECFQAAHELGMTTISGRKAFEKPMKDGVELLHAIQDVYLCTDITVA